MNLLGLIKDKWVQCSFANTSIQDQQVEKEWNKQNISQGASTIKDMLHGFKYIIELDHLKVYSEHHGMHGWLVPAAFREEFFYPHRELGDHTVITMMRGSYTNNAKIFEHNEFGDKDAVFAGTNNENDALLLALRYK